MFLKSYFLSAPQCSKLLSLLASCVAVDMKSQRCAAGQLLSPSLSHSVTHPKDKAHCVRLFHHCITSFVLPLLCESLFTEEAPQGPVEIHVFHLSAVGSMTLTPTRGLGLQEACSEQNTVSAGLRAICISLAFLVHPQVWSFNNNSTAQEASLREHACISAASLHVTFHGFSAGSLSLPCWQLHCEDNPIYGGN